MPVPLEYDDEPAHFRGERLERAAHLFPRAVSARKRDLGDGGERGTRAADIHFRLARKAHLLDEHAEIVRFPFIERHAVIIPAADGKAGVFETVNAAHAQHEIGRIGRRDAARLRNIMRARARNVPVRRLLLAELHGGRRIEIVVREILEFERIVDDHFGVQPAVRRLIDVLKKQAVEMLADFDAALALVQRESDHNKTLPCFFFHCITSEKARQRLAEKNLPFSAPRIPPRARRYPNPDIGTVAPAPANRTI